MISDKYYNGNSDMGGRRAEAEDGIVRLRIERIYNVVGHTTHEQKPRGNNHLQLVTWPSPSTYPVEATRSEHTCVER